MLYLIHSPRHPCPARGQIHPYLTHVILHGACYPIVFPPDVLATGSKGTGVEVVLAGPVEAEREGGEWLAYRQLAKWVRQTTIRYEGCGERFGNLEVYRLHDCEVRYR